ncbi:DUF6612 family protein [Paenibacillus elgii]|uniref:DUF6612 family protein n=1 Tax=Paenibacillus elgii TaxID=189691 RepID=UPI00203D3F3E|nr:DUF6612 family protein [Paenibacillus elgii]MCM3272132.1 hypothetical protein [Paenibacillus elgii]
MYRKKIALALCALLVVMAVLAGCGAKPAPKETLEKAFQTAADMKSADYKMTFAMNMDFPADALAENPQLAVTAQMLKNMEVAVTGAYQQEPFQMEMNIEAKLKGDMAMNINLPIVMTDQKIWVKVPNIPMLPLPKDVVGKFVELDPKELAKQSDQKVNFDAATIKKQQELGQEIGKVFFKHVDEKTFLSSVDKKDAKLPETVEANQIVKFAVTNENLEPFITTVAEKVLPEVLDLMMSDKYAKVFDFKKEDLEQAKKDLTANSGDKLKSEIAKMKEDVKIKDLQITTAVNKKGFPVYHDVNVGLEVKENGKPSQIGANIKAEYSKINEKPEFKIGIPKDVITLEQLMAKTNGM